MYATLAAYNVELGTMDGTMRMRALTQVIIPNTAVAYEQISKAICKPGL